MWKYYKRVNPFEPGSKPQALFRVDGIKVERYAVFERWITPAAPGRIVMDISGMGDGWASIDEIPAGEVEAVKEALFPNETG